MQKSVLAKSLSELLEWDKSHICSLPAKLHLTCFEKEKKSFFSRFTPISMSILWFCKIHQWRYEMKYEFKETFRMFQPHVHLSDILLPELVQRIYIYQYSPFFKYMYSVSTFLIHQMSSGPYRHPYWINWFSFHS